MLSSTWKTSALIRKLFNRILKNSLISKTSILKILPQTSKSYFQKLQIHSWALFYGLDVLEPLGCREFLSYMIPFRSRVRDPSQIGICYHYDLSLPSTPTSRHFVNWLWGAQFVQKMVVSGEECQWFVRLLRCRCSVHAPEMMGLTSFS